MERIRRGAGTYPTCPTYNMTNPKDIPDPPKASELETALVKASKTDAYAEMMDTYNIHKNPEYAIGVKATGPNCPWCGRPEVENMQPGQKVRCFCDRLYIIAERK